VQYASDYYLSVLGITRWQLRSAQAQTERHYVLLEGSIGPGALLCSPSVAIDEIQFIEGLLLAAKLDQCARQAPVSELQFLIAFGLNQSELDQQFGSIPIRLYFPSSHEILAKPLSKKIIWDQLRKALRIAW
jgi:hypothetical protein